MEDHHIHFHILARIPGRAESPPPPPLPSSAFPATGPSWRSGEGGGRGGGLHHAGRSGLDEGGGDAGDHLVHQWSSDGGGGGGGAKSESWDGRGRCGGSSASDFYGKGDDYCRYAERAFHERSGVGGGGGGDAEGERVARDGFDMAFRHDADGDKPGYGRSDSYEVGYEETAYGRDAAHGAPPAVNHPPFYSRDAFRQSGVDEGGGGGGDRQPGLSHGYPGRPEDPGSSQSSGDGGGWRGVDGWDFQGSPAAALLKAAPAPSNGRYPQKLDSFSEAFQTYRLRGPLAVAEGGPGAGRHHRPPTATAAAAAALAARFETGRGECAGWPADANQGCRYGPASDPYGGPPHSSFFPPHPSLPSLPSPPSQLMPSVLSPPPTPLPPPSLSPPQGECPHPFPRDGEYDLAASVQFFPPHSHQPSPPGGVIWKFPGLPHCYPQQSCEHRVIAEGNHRPHHGDEGGGPAEHQSVLLAPESSFMSCSPLTPSSLTPSFPTPSSLHPSFHLAHLPSFHQRKEGRVTSCPPPQAPEVQSGSPGQSHPNKQIGTPSTYRETPFPSMLRRGEDARRRGRYTPRPILNPSRQEAGLYSSLVSPLGRCLLVRGGGDAEEQCTVAPCINVGPDFQADLPACTPGRDGSPRPRPRPTEEEEEEEEASPREQLLWKPFPLLEESVVVQDQVEQLLSMCNSSCLPGGGANTELALHCLHHCNGDTMATLETLLLSLQATAAGDYHYSGSDMWTGQERAVFGEGLRTLGKDFYAIQSMVRTKSVRQCVEFYYLGKRLVDVQRRQADRQRERDAAEAIAQQVTPAPQQMRTLVGPERAVPASPLANFFPCKMCGKMFFKIKSRNAHMKIHRQPPEDWSERRLQPQQLLAHRLNAAHGLSPSLGGGPNTLLQPQASPRAYSFQGLALPSSSNNSSSSNHNNHVHPDSVLNSFEVSNDHSGGGGGGGGVVAHASDMRIKNGISTLTAFGGMSETNPQHDVPGGGVSDSVAANQRGPPDVRSPVQQPWTLWTG